MNKTKVVWLDVNLHTWEHDWLLDLFNDIEIDLQITNSFENLTYNENCVVIANHAINYRAYLDALKSKGTKYGIVLLSDENLREPMEYLHDPHCKFVARNYFSPIYHPHPKLFTFGLGYKKGFGAPKDTLPKFSDRELSWCFAGSIHDDERKKATQLFQDNIKYPHKVHFCSGFNAEDGIGTEEYKKMMHQSQFALSPQGQVNNDSFRTYEALEAGCIPITMANSPMFKVVPSYWHAIFLGDKDLPFIIEDTWEDALEKVKEIHSQNRGDEIQTKCIEFWARWKQNWRNEFAHRVQLLQ